MVSLQFIFVVLSVTACRQGIENVKVDGRVITFFHCVLNTFSGFIEALDSKGIVHTLTSETISDSKECYAGLSVLFESSAACL